MRAVIAKWYSMGRGCHDRSFLGRYENNNYLVYCWSRYWLYLVGVEVMIARWTLETIVDAPDRSRDVDIPYARRGLAMTDRIAEIERIQREIARWLSVYPTWKQTRRQYDSQFVQQFVDYCQYLLAQLREREHIIRELWDFVDTYSYADNSGGEYDPACIACGTHSRKHEVGCALEKILAHPAMRAGEEER